MRLGEMCVAFCVEDGPRVELGVADGLPMLGLSDTARRVVPVSRTLAWDAGDCRGGARRDRDTSRRHAHRASREQRRRHDDCRHPSDTRSSRLLDVT